MQLSHSKGHLRQASSMPNHLGLLWGMCMLPQLCQGNAGPLDSWTLLAQADQGLQCLGHNLWHHLRE